MTVDVTEIDSHLDAASRAERFDPFWLVTGNDEFLMLETGDKIRAAAVAAGYTERVVLELGARSDWSTLTEATASFGMFDEKKIVEVRFAGAPGTKGTPILKEVLSHAYEGVTSVFFMPTPDWTAAKASWWTEWKKATTVVECNTPERRQLPSWLTRRMARNGQSASPETLEIFADLIEGNLFAAHQEVEKLALLYPARELTKEEVERSVLNASHYETAALLSAICIGEPARAARIVDALEAQAEPLVPILTFLTMQIRSLIKLRSGYDRRITYVKGVFATPELSRGAKRLSVKRLAAALDVCADIDRLIKGLPVRDRDSDPWVELKSVALFLAR